MSDTLKLKVQNVTCGHCVRTIERELAALAGVSGVRATEEGAVSLEHDSSRTSRREIDALLEEIGYPIAG